MISLLGNAAVRRSFQSHSAAVAARTRSKTLIRAPAPPPPALATRGAHSLAPADYSWHCSCGATCYTSECFSCGNSRGPSRYAEITREVSASDQGAIKQQPRELGSGVSGSSGLIKDQSQKKIKRVSALMGSASAARALRDFVIHAAANPEQALNNGDNEHPQDESLPSSPDPSLGPYLIAFYEKNPEAKKAVKRHGGLKRLCEDFPDMVTRVGPDHAASYPRGVKSAFLGDDGNDGMLVAPLGSEQAEIRRTMTKPVDLVAAFKTAGGTVHDMAEWRTFFKAPPKVAPATTAGETPTTSASQSDDDGCGSLLPKPLAIAVDVEGTHLDPPLLVQVSAMGSSSRVFLETPHRKKGLSKELMALLNDPAIVKVFCDASGDLNALGVDGCTFVDVQKHNMTQRLLRLGREQQQGQLSESKTVGRVGNRSSLTELLSGCSVLPPLNSASGDSSSSGSGDGGGSLAIGETRDHFVLRDEFGGGGGEEEEAERTTMVVYRKDKNMSRKLGMITESRISSSSGGSMVLSESMREYGAADAWATMVVFEHQQRLSSLEKQKKSKINERLQRLATNKKSEKESSSKSKMKSFGSSNTAKSSGSSGVQTETVASAEMTTSKNNTPPFIPPSQTVLANEWAVWLASGGQAHQIFISDYIKKREGGQQITQDELIERYVTMDPNVYAASTLRAFLQSRSASSSSSSSTTSPSLPSTTESVGSSQGGAAATAAPAAADPTTAVSVVAGDDTADEDDREELVQFAKSRRLLWKSWLLKTFKKETSMPSGEGELAYACPYEYPPVGVMMSPSFYSASVLEEFSNHLRDNRPELLLAAKGTPFKARRGAKAGASLSSAVATTAAPTVASTVSLTAVCS